MWANFTPNVAHVQPKLTQSIFFDSRFFCFCIWFSYLLSPRVLIMMTSIRAVSGCCCLRLDLCLNIIASVVHNSQIKGTNTINMKNVDVNMGRRLYHPHFCWQKQLLSRQKSLLSTKVTFVRQKYFCVTHGVTIRQVQHLRILSRQNCLCQQKYGCYKRRSIIRQ